MTAPGAEALYERVLAQLPRHELHASWNKVLQADFAWICHALDDVTSAFVKLGEVGTAATQLEQSNGATGSGNASLLSAMEDTMALQQMLEGQVNRIAMELGTESVRKKRKTREDSILETQGNKVRPTTQVPATTTDSRIRPNSTLEKDLSETEESDSDSGSESDSKSEWESEDSDGDGGSEAALKALMKAQATQSRRSRKKEEVKQTKEGQRTMKEVEKVPPQALQTEVYKSAVARISLAATALCPIVKEVDALPRTDRILITPEILNALSESVVGDSDGRQRDAVICSLERVIEWAKNPAGQTNHVRFYRKYAETVKSCANNIPYSERSDSMKRLGWKLSGLLDDFTRYTDVDAERSATKTKAMCMGKSLYLRVKQISTSVRSERRQQLLGLIVSYKAMIAFNISKKQYSYARDALYIMAHWANEGPHEPELLCLYCLLVDVSRSFGIQALFDDTNRFVFLRMTDRMIELIAETPSYKAQEFLADIKDRAAKHLSALNDWQRSSVAPADIKKNLHVLKHIISHVTHGWVSREDPTVHKCVDVLKHHIQKHKDHTQLIDQLDFIMMDDSKRMVHHHTMKTSTCKITETKRQAKRKRKAKKENVD